MYPPVAQLMQEMSPPTHRLMYISERRRGESSRDVNIKMETSFDVNDEEKELSHRVNNRRWSCNMM